MKKVLINFIILTGALFALTATAQIQYSNEFWISTNATGNIYPASNGSLASPLDGSTEANFTTNVYALPPNSVIHILPGVYQEYAYWDNPGWVKTGDKVIGSGIDSTIIQLDNTAHDGLSVLDNYNFGNDQSVEISDLTADANSDPSTSVGHNGIEITGTQNAIRRVKVIDNWSDGSEEILGIALGNDNLPDSTGNVIEECVVSNYLGGTVDGISFGGGSPVNMASGIIKDNFVYFPPVEPISVYPICLAFVQNTLIEGNYISGGQVQVHCDTGGFRNTIIAHNFFLNCLNAVAPYTVGTNEDHITIAFNDIYLILTNNYTSIAFDFGEGTQSDVKVIGNTIQTTGSGPSGAYVMTASEINGLMFADNSVDSLLASNQVTTPWFFGVTNLNMFNNYDLFGNYLPSLNIPTIGGVEVTPFGLSLISSAEVSSALTNLGLPGNPSEVVTNSQSGVTLSGTFNGNGSGLTGLNWSDITGAPAFAQYSDPSPTFTNGMNIGAGMAYQIGGNNVLWVSNAPGIGENLVVGIEPPGTAPNGLGNLVVGSYAMQDSTNANYSTMVGINAGRNTLSSQNNTFIGADTGYLLQGIDNTLVGSGFGAGSFTNGYENTGIGFWSFYRAMNGTNNVALGYLAGSWLYSGNNNVFIAHQGTSAETNSNGTIYIGDPGVHNATYIAGNVYAGGGVIGTSLIATNGFQCSTNYTPSLWTPVPGSVIFRASNNWMYAISQFSTNAAFKIGP